MIVNSLAGILIFPGLLFLIIFGFAAEYFDRKFYAKMQNRVGPPWFQPFADFLKLASKEDMVPEEANSFIFKIAPILALTAAVTAYFYIPLWNAKAVSSFSGDVIVVLYLLTIPTMTFFLGGWYSTSLYSKIGAVRSLTQLFAYEVPLFMAILGASILADSWELSRITAFYSAHPLYCLFNIIGFFISIIAMLGKLEKVPFDIPEAETEIVAGAFTEYGGRLLAIFRLCINIETVVGSSLIAAVFLPFGFGPGGVIGFLFYLLKVLFVMALLSLSRTVFARLRIDQMIGFCWKYVSPVAFCQVLINLFMKGLIAR